MAESGLQMTVKVDDAGGTLRDISADVLSVALNTPRGVRGLSSLDGDALESILLTTDGRLTLVGLFNDAANLSHDVLKSVASTSVERSVEVSVSGQTLHMEMLFSRYAVSRSADGGLIWTAAASLSDGETPAWASS